MEKCFFACLLFAFFAGFGLHHPTARGDDFLKIAEACPSLVSLQNKIEYCSQNTLASLKAKTCLEESKAAYKKISLLLAGINADPLLGQQFEVQQVRAKYHSTLVEIAALVRAMQASSLLMATYPLAMIEDLNAQDGGPELPCYTEAFQSVQASVIEIDNQIETAMKLLEKFSYLETKTSYVGGKIQSGSNTKMLYEKKSAEEFAPQSQPVSGDEAKGGSEISKSRGEWEKRKSK